MKKVLTLVAFVAVLALSGCGNGSKMDITKKAEGIKTKSELESKLGKPQEFSSMGPMETWTYKASDGEVVFVIIGDKVTLKAAGGDGKSK